MSNIDTTPKLILGNGEITFQDDKFKLNKQIQLSNNSTNKTEDIINSGTINKIKDRLDSLGFKEGNIANFDGNITLSKLGKFAILRKTTATIYSWEGIGEDGYLTFTLSTTNGLNVISDETFETNIVRDAQGIGGYSSTTIKFTKGSNLVKILALPDTHNITLYGFSIGFKIQ